MKRIVLMDVDDSDDGFDNTVVGVVEITPELAKLIMKLGKVAKGMKSDDENFARIAYWDHSVDYVIYDDELEVEQTDDLTDGISVFVESSPFPPDRRTERTDNDQMLVDAEEVWWRATPKHTKCIVTTSPIKLTDIEPLMEER